MDLAERIAKFIVETRLPDVELEYFEEQSHGEPDFEILYADGKTGYLEVTTSTEAEKKSMRAAIRKEKWVTAASCKYGWWVIPFPKANINRIRDEVDRYLAAIEAEGLTRFFFPTQAFNSAAVHAIGSELKVQYGVVHKWKEPRRRIFISELGDGARLDVEEVLLAVQAEATKHDIARKMAMESTGTNHLFIFVDADNYPAWYPLTRSVEEQPSEPLNLPEAIGGSGIWVAALMGTRVMVWSAPEGDTFTEYDVIEVAEDSMQEWFE